MMMRGQGLRVPPGPGRIALHGLQDSENSFTMRWAWQRLTALVEFVVGTTFGGALCWLLSDACWMNTKSSGPSSKALELSRRLASWPSFHCATKSSSK
jgi:hypothetical protein